MVQGQVTPHLVLQLAPAAALVLQPAAQRGAGQLQRRRQHGQRGRGVALVQRGTAMAPHPVTHAAGHHLLQKNGLRRVPQKGLEAGGVHHHGGLQHPGVKVQCGGRCIKPQHRAEHAAVFVGMGGLRVGPVQPADGHPAPGQPAQQAMQHHQQGFVGKTARVQRSGVGRLQRQPACGNAAGDHQAGTAAADAQAHIHVVQKQPKPPICLAQRRAHRGCTGQRVAQHGKSAHLHAAGVQTKKLIVQQARHRNPEPGKGRRWHPCRWLQQHIGRDVCRLQHGLALRRTQGQHGAAHKGAGHRGGHRVVDRLVGRLVDKPTGRLGGAGHTAILANHVRLLSGDAITRRRGWV